MGGVTLGAPGALVTETSRASHLDGTTGYVQVGDLFPFTGRAPMTLEAWVKSDVFDNQYRGLITNEPDRPETQRDGYLLWVNGPDGLGFERFKDGGRDGMHRTTLQIGTYGRVVVTYDGATARVYVDAKEVVSFNSQISLAAPADSQMVLGARVGGTGDLFHGTLDEVAIYDYSLAPARIAVHYQVGAGL